MSERRKMTDRMRWLENVHAQVTAAIPVDAVSEAPDAPLVYRALVPWPALHQSLAAEIRSLSAALKHS